MYFKVCLIFIFLFVLSCSKIEFVYKNDIDTNKDIYNKTSVVISGIDIPSLYGHSLRYLGNDDKGLYLIKINIDEKKIKRSVQSNQAISKLDYKLFFKYELSNVEKQCVIYEKEIITRFTFEPQSSGYNFGSDESLDKQYETSARDSLQQFINYLSGIDLNYCINEN